MVKLFITDMDQTLLDDDSQLPKRTQEIIDRLEKEKKMFIVASGRTLTNLEYKFKDIDHNLSFISDNGAIVKHKGEILHTEVIDENQAESVINTMRAMKDANIVVIKADMAYIENDREDHMDVLREYYNKLTVVDDLMNYRDGVIKITSLSLNDSHENYLNHVENKLDDGLHGVESGDVWIDVTKKGVNKGKSLQILMDKYDIKPEEVVSFGDYFNDLEMIQIAKYGYVVENGAEGLKEHAYEVIGKNTDDAVIHKILEHLE